MNTVTSLMEVSYSSQAAPLLPPMAGAAARTKKLSSTPTPKVIPKPIARCRHVSVVASSTVRSSCCGSVSGSGGALPVIFTPNALTRSMKPDILLMRLHHRSRRLAQVRCALLTSTSCACRAPPPQQRCQLAVSPEVWQQPSSMWHGETSPVIQ